MPMNRFTSCRGGQGRVAERGDSPWFSQLRQLPLFAETDWPSSEYQFSIGLGALSCRAGGFVPFCIVPKHSALKTGRICTVVQGRRNQRCSAACICTCNVTTSCCSE
jgi:hypothetical protein